MKFSISSSVAVITVLLTLCAGNNVPCDIESCLHMYNNLKSLLDTIASDNNQNQQDDITTLMTSRICPLHQDLSICIKSQSKTCRGNLYFHFVEKLVKDITVKLSKNCTLNASASASVTGGRSSERSKSDRNASRHSQSGHNNHNFHPDHMDSSQGKCMSKAVPNEPMVGCALYGVTNLKGFSDPINITNIPYCSLSGAWSLIDTPEFTIQITNKGGFNPMPKDTTTTTLVTVIIRSNECSVRKTYQATFEEVPHMFLDGSTTAKNVYIESIREGEHIKIHLPYISTVVDIFKLTGHLPLSSLSITIKMPAANLTNLLSDSKRIRGLPLCFYGCPRTASIRPRSIADSSSHKCQSSSVAAEGTVESFERAADSENSISSAICDSLHSVKSILGDVSVLEQRLRFPGEENSAISSANSESDINSKSNSKFHLTNNERFASAENSALTSQSVGSIYYSYHCCLFLYFSVISLLYFS